MLLLLIYNRLQLKLVATMLVPHQHCDQPDFYFKDIVASELAKAGVIYDLIRPYRLDFADSLNIPPSAYYQPFILPVE